jgi:sodium transport system permease protein
VSMRHSWLVYRKEMLETLRDRRTLIVMVVLPLVLYPIMGVGLTQWVGLQESRRTEEPSRVALSGPYWPALEQNLVAAEKISVSRVGGKGKGKGGKGITAEDRLRAEKLDLVLRVPEGFDEAASSDRTVELSLMLDASKDRSLQARRRVMQVVEALAGRLREQRLERRGLPGALVQPIATLNKDVASGEAIGARIISGVVPLLIVLMILLGAFYPAIDPTAGEKERGTLETLLVAPVPRTSLITGKFLVVASIATCTGLLNLGSIGLTLGLGFGPALEAAGVAAQIPWSAVALTAVAIVPTALFFAAVMVAAASMARSFKEAQNLLTPIYMICMLPAMAAAIPGIKLNALTALAPVVNVSLLTRDLIAGNLQLFPAALAVLSIGVYTALALKVAARIFDSERLLFAPDPALRKGVDGKRRVVAHANPVHAGVLLLIVMALILLVGQRLQARNVIVGILVTEWALIMLPVLLLLRFARVELRPALALNRAHVLTLVGAVLAGLSAWYLVGTLVEVLQQRIFPMPPEMIKAFHKAVLAPDRHIALDLFALALSPAICEEVLFRGVLLQSTRRAMSPRAAILINGVLFGLFHLSPWRFIPTLLLGMLLALIVLRSGSLLPGVVFHFLNNASAIVAGRIVGVDPEGVGKASGLNPSLLGLALALFCAGLWLALRRRGEAAVGQGGPAPDG